jgi:energy-coupling factor transporter ATP-binding protein EcfA2
VRFRRIEVRSYRAIEQADLDFAPGLNVLHGPNDLGKSTLASAIRTALLLPAESSAHQAFVPWHDAGPPSVRLTFERDGAIYRVSKVFGTGSSASARLESSADGASFHEEERGRAVERRLRELLRWGIELPGGKGQSRGLPDSFLSQVLLGSQSDVPLVLERSLADDRDGSGRERLHEALQALAQDPVFKRVLDAAQAKVDAAFTPTGRRKTGQTSPFAQLKDQIAQLAQEFERLSQQRRESEEVALRIAHLGEQRARLEAEVGELEARAAREAEQLERLAARRQALERVATAEAAVREVETLAEELAALERELVAAREASEALGRRVAQAIEVRAAAEGRAAAAELASIEQTSEAALERRAAERAVLEAGCQKPRDERARLSEVVELGARLEAAEATQRARAAALATSEAAEAAARRDLEALDAELGKLTALEAVLAWREAELGAERARAAARELGELEAQAATLRARAAALEAEAAPSEAWAGRLDAFRELERQRAVAAARLEVGLGIELRLPRELSVELSVDGGPARARPSPGAPIRQRAKSRLSARIEGGIELDVSAGDPALREAFEMLERRWLEEVLPVLGAAEVTSVAALAERIEAGRASARAATEATRDAERAEARAAEKRESAAELDALELRVEQRRRALGEGAAERWLLELDALRPKPRARGAGDGTAPGLTPLSAAEVRALETLLGSRRQASAGQRSRLEAQLAAHAAARAEAMTRASAAREARDALAAQRLAAWVALAGERPLPDASALGARVAELERAVRAAAAALEAWQAEQGARVNAARAERETAARALAAARESHDAALAAHGAARERWVSLEARLRERRASAASRDPVTALQALERARAELDVYAGLEAITPERAAATRNELERARAELDQTLAELRRAEGALGHVGGDVVVLRERSTQEALERARVLEVEQEREYDAYRLLLETLREVENEQGVHLGRALEAPVSERFARLTDGRYSQIGLDAGLGLQGVAIAGRQRHYRELSEGTQEQLATILRLCIAEYLDTALVLDDHLAQTHRERARWFRETLRQASARIQIVVLTARPEDYVDETEPESGGVGGPAVRVVDLERVIRRARYAPPPGSP